MTRILAGEVSLLTLTPYTHVRAPTAVGWGFNTAHNFTSAFVASQTSLAIDGDVSPEAAYLSLDYTKSQAYALVTGVVTNTAGGVASVSPCNTTEQLGFAGRMTGLVACPLGPSPSTAVVALTVSSLSESLSRVYSVSAAKPVSSSVHLFRAVSYLLSHTPSLPGAIVWMLRATWWMLRAIVWMPRATWWTLRAVVWMLRATLWVDVKGYSVDAKGYIVGGR
eukprot:1192597-Prorocentrum_minimum.AAC.2